MSNLRNYLRIGEAAELLGVSQATLRNWGRNGKIATHRNPLNGYRLYRKSDLRALLKKVARSRRG
jgi:excisionase family DNA binding protein